MRLDKYLTEAGAASRKEAAILARKGAITVDGAVVKRPDLHIEPGKQTVCLRGERVDWREHWYFLLHKPTGYVSSTDDPGAPTVIELLPDKLKKLQLFPCGRLDRNTTGLLLLTTDGALAHQLLSPKRHVSKRYRYEVKFPLSASDIAALEAGVTIEGGYTTMPCKVEAEGEKSGIIALREGKYHQIKLMMKAVHNQITALSRISFGTLMLDPSLRPGEYRELTEEEIEQLRACTQSGEGEKN